MNMVNKEDQMNKICKHSLLTNVSVVGGYYECLGMGVEIKDLSRKIQTSKVVFFGYLESLISADESIFPRWFNRENAKWIKSMSNFDWENGNRYCQFYDWLEKYLPYLQNL